jgi:hypothetical protein
MNVLFWNTNGRAIHDPIASIASDSAYRPDVIVLAESGVLPNILLPALAKAGAGNFVYAPSKCDRVSVYHKASIPLRPPVRDSRYFSIREWKGFKLPLLMVAAHLPSKLRYSVKTQELVCGDLAQQMRRVEKKYPSHSLFVIGDLNLNPFEQGMVGADRLHATLDRRIAADETRKVTGRHYRFLYNPSWRHLGDCASNPGGTYYRRSSDSDCIFWHVYDQAAVRPSLLPFLPDDCFSVISSAGSVSLRSDGKMIPVKKVSDHLPILLRLNV